MVIIGEAGNIRRIPASFYLISVLWYQAEKRQCFVMVVAGSVQIRQVPVRSKARSGTFCGYGNISVFQFGMKIDFFRLFGYNHFRAKEKRKKEDTILTIDESILSKLTDEQKKKAQSAQSPDELLAIAKEAGYELSAEHLEAIAGGKWEPCWDNCVVYDVCPYFE